MVIERPAINCFGQLKVGYYIHDSKQKKTKEYYRGKSLVVVNFVE